MQLDQLKFHAIFTVQYVSPNAVCVKLLLCVVLPDVQLPPPGLITVFGPVAFTVITVRQVCVMVHVCVRFIQGTVYVSLPPYTCPACRTGTTPPPLGLA